MNKAKAQKVRREEIIQAALAAYSEKGLFNTRIEEVALVAGIGKGTVYEYFRSKEELMAAAIRYDMEELARLVKEKIDQESNVRDKINVMMETVMYHRQQSCYKGFDMNPSSIGDSMKELQSLLMEQNTTWRDWLEEIVDLGVERGEIRWVDPQVLLGAIMGAVMNVVQPFGNSDLAEYDPVQAAESLTEFFYDGIRKR
jgi:TetR/AcrR family fatty acid metabolism transcriptional regulator